MTLVLTAAKQGIVCTRHVSHVPQSRRAEHDAPHVRRAMDAMLAGGALRVHPFPCAINDDGMVTLLIECISRERNRSAKERVHGSPAARGRGRRGRARGGHGMAHIQDSRPVVWLVCARAAAGCFLQPAARLRRATPSGNIDN